MAHVGRLVATHIGFAHRDSSLCRIPFGFGKRAGPEATLMWR